MTQLLPKEISDVATKPVTLGKRITQTQGKNSTYITVHMEQLCITMMGICSEKCVVRRFLHANIIECTYTNLGSIAYYM